MNYTYDVWISPLPEEVDPPSMAMAGMQWLGHATRKMFYMVTPSELALDDTDPVVSISTWVRLLPPNLTQPLLPIKLHLPKKSFVREDTLFLVLLLVLVLFP